MVNTRMAMRCMTLLSAQPTMKYPLIDGQGNFGSVDGDRAAMRYTEIRMERIAHELLADLGKDTVDYVPNYDGTRKSGRASTKFLIYC